MPPASIKISELIDVAAPVDVVWAKITDPHFVVTCVPGARVLGEQPDGTVEGALEVKLGPTVVDFHGTALPEYEPAEHRGRLTAQGADKGGRTRAQATMTFDVRPAEGGTTVEFNGTIDLAGGLASFLQTGGVHLTRRMMKDFGEQMSARIEAPAGAASADPTTSSDPAAPAADIPVNKPVNGFRLFALVLWDLLRSPFRRRRPAHKESS